MTPKQCLSLYGVLGFCSMIVQPVLIREFLVVVHGNELCIGLLLGGWLFWIAVGAELGAKLAPRIKHPVSAFAFCLTLTAWLLPLQILIIRSARLLLGVPGGEFLPLTPTLLLALLALAPFSFVVGFTFPLGVRLWPKQISEDASRVAWIYVVESVGSLLGGALFTLVLVHYLHAFWCAAMVMVLLFGMVGFLWWVGSVKSLDRKGEENLALSLDSDGAGKEAKAKEAKAKEAKAKWVKLMAFLQFTPLVFLFWVNWLQERTVNLRFQSLGTGTTLVESVDSPYQNIVVSEREGQYSVYCDGQYAFSFPDPSVAGLMAELILSQHPDPKKVLVIGGGLEGLISQILRLKVKALHYVQVDPQLVRTVRPYLHSGQSRYLHNPSLRIFFTDGRRFLHTRSDKYDLIYLNLPDPSTALLNRYYTLDFFREAKSHLTSGGVFCFHLTASESYFGPALGPYVAVIFHTLRSVFSHIAVCPGETAYFFATDATATVSQDPETLIKRIKRRGNGELPVPAEALYSFFPPGLAEWMVSELNRRQVSVFNTDLHPVAYFYYLLLWVQRSEPRLFSFFERFASCARLWFNRLWFGSPPQPAASRSQLSPSRLTPSRSRLQAKVWSVGVLLLFLLIVGAMGWLVVRRQLHNREKAVMRAVLFAVSAAGFAAMGLVVVLLLAFQSLYGALYQMVGMLTASFMAGFALGGWTAAVKLVPRPHSSPLLRQGERGNKGSLKAMVLVQVAIVGFAFLLPGSMSILSPALAAGEWVTVTTFVCLLAISGWLTGMGLPLCADLYFGTGTSLSRAAGKVDQADHLGACLGAILVSVPLLPVLGAGRTCLIIAILNLIGAVWLYFAYHIRDA